MCVGGGGGGGGRLPLGSRKFTDHEHTKLILHVPGLSIKWTGKRLVTD